MNSNLNGGELNWIHQESATSRSGNDKYRRHKKVLSIVAIVSAVIVFGLLCAYAGRVSTQVSTNIEEVEADSDNKDCENHLNLNTNEESSSVISSPQWTWTKPPDSNAFNSRILFFPNRPTPGLYEIKSVAPDDYCYNKIESYCNTDTFTGKKWEKGSQFALSADGSKVVIVFKSPCSMIVKPITAKSKEDVKIIVLPDEDDTIVELIIRPDGKEIAFKTLKNPTQIQTVDLETITFKQIQLMGDPSWDFHASLVYSPDSKYIYMGSMINTRYLTISTFDVQTGALVREYRHQNYRISHFTISPDGKNFIVVGELKQTSTFYLFSVDAQDGSNEHVIFETEYRILWPNVSPDGKSVIYQLLLLGDKSSSIALAKVLISPETQRRVKYIKDEAGKNIDSCKAIWISI